MTCFTIVLPVNEKAVGSKSDPAHCNLCASNYVCGPSTSFVRSRIEASTKRRRRSSIAEFWFRELVHNAVMHSHTSASRGKRLQERASVAARLAGERGMHARRVEDTVVQCPLKLNRTCRGGWGWGSGSRRPSRWRGAQEKGQTPPEVKVGGDWGESAIVFVCMHVCMHLERPFGVELGGKGLGE